MIKAFQDKITTVSDKFKPIYQSIVDNITKENADELCKYFCIASVQEVKDFVDNVMIDWLERTIVKTRQRFIATAKACKYACKWCILFYTNQDFLDSLTA